MALWVPLWTTSLVGRGSTLPPELLLPQNSLLHLSLLLHPTDQQRLRPRTATPTPSTPSPHNTHSRSISCNLPSTHNPPISMTRTPTPAEPARTTLDRLYRTNTNLPSPSNISNLNNSTLPSSRCRLASVSDQLHRLPTRHCRHCPEVNSMVVLTMLPCRPRQNARTLVGGMTPHSSKISVPRVETSTNQLRLLRLFRTRWDRLGLHLVHHRTSTRARVHRSPLHPGQAVSILAPLHHHRTGCNHRRNLDLDRTGLLLRPTVCHHLNR